MKSFLLTQTFSGKESLLACQLKKKCVQRHTAGCTYTVQTYLPCDWVKCLCLVNGKFPGWENCVTLGLRDVSLYPEKQEHTGRCPRSVQGLNLNLVQGLNLSLIK